MKLISRLKASAFWFTLPSFAVAAFVAVAVAGYSPLVFDPSLYAPQTADAVELDSVDAAAIEAEHAGEPADVELDSPAADVGGALADGTWTGYAACGMGNPDGWKPYYVGVTVEVSGGEVAGITQIFGSSSSDGGAALDWDASENQKYLDWAISGRDGAAGVKAQLAGRGVVSGIDTVSGATYSSAAIFNAYIAALGKSAAAAGSVLDSPASGVGDGDGDAGAGAGTDGASKPIEADEAVSSSKLADGSWTGYATCGKGNPDGWKPYYVAVTVKVKGGEVRGITSIAGSSTGAKGADRLSWDADENQSYLDWACDGRTRLGVVYEGVRSQINSALAEGRKPGGVDTVSGATYSSKAIVAAYYDALRQSAEAAGSKLETPKDESSDEEKEEETKDSLDSIEADENPGDLADGTWTGYAACGEGNPDNWKPYYVGVTVEIKGGAVEGISKIFGSATSGSDAETLSWDADENQSYLDWAINGRTRLGAFLVGVKAQIETSFSSGGRPASIDTVSGATYSSKAIFKAYYDALRQSAEAAGTTVDEPDEPEQPDEPDEPEDPDEPDEPDEPENPKVDELADGSWTAYAKCGPDPDRVWNPYYVGVTVLVDGGKAKSIEDVVGSSSGEEGDAALTWDEDENGEYLDGARAGVVAQLKDSLSAGELPRSVDTVSGATYSSKAIFKAFYAALQKSAAAADSDIEVPDDSGDSDDPEDPEDLEDLEDPDNPDNPDNPEDPDNPDDPDDPDDEAGYYGFALCERSATSSDSWSPYYIFVKVLATDGTVSQISRAYGDADGIVDADILYSASENSVYLSWAIDGKFGGTGYRMKSVVKQIQSKIDAGDPGDVSGISTVSGATRSSKAIVAAYQMALQNAADGVGTTPEEAVALADSQDGSS